MNIGLLLLRVVLAALMYMHATQKLFGWFSGPGLDRAGQIFESLGQRPGRQMALLAAACEAGGALLVLTGLAVPLGAAMVAGTMLVAGAAATIAKGAVWNAAGGGEYPLALSAFAVILGFTGPGSWSVDQAIKAPWLPSSGGQAAVTGLIVAVVAVLAAAGPILRTRRQLAARAAAAASTPPSPAGAP